MDNLKPEGILAIIVAIGGSIWTAIHMFFGVKSDVAALERRADSHDKELQNLRHSADQRFEEVRADIFRVGDKTEKRHDIIEGKIDRLIERSLKP